MRRWHKLFAPIFALFILIIAVTGVLTKAVPLFDQPPAKTEKAQSPTNAAMACATKPAKPKRSALGEFGHTVKAIHSGETFGVVGTVLNIGSGLALIFFAISGFWMYLQMWLRRRRVKTAR